jgi:hypothetical protein
MQRSPKRGTNRESRGRFKRRFEIVIPGLKDGGSSVDPSLLEVLLFCSISFGSNLEALVPFSCSLSSIQMLLWPLFPVSSPFSVLVFCPEVLAAANS